MKLNPNQLLIDFDCIVDTDFGLIKTIKKEYIDNDFIKPLLSYMNDSIMISELLDRENKNPLNIVLKDEYLSSADSLYNEFIESEYKSILDNSIATSLFGWTSMICKAEGIVITIICKNKLQEQIIKQLYKDIPISVLIINNLKDIDLKEYKTIVLKYYSDILDMNLKDIIAKNIFICNYKFNIDNNHIPLIEISKIIGYSNIVSIIDVYDSNKYIKVNG